MAYMVVEWVDGGDISVINQAWLTPKKKEAFWPPCKALSGFNKLIKEIEPVIGEDWVLHGVKRVMYKTDDFEKAQKKCREAEDTSNLETGDEDISKSKRRIKAKRFISMSGDESDGDGSQNSQKSKKIAIERPPRIFVQENPSINISSRSSTPDGRNNKSFKDSSCFDRECSPSLVNVERFSLVSDGLQLKEIPPRFGNGCYSRSGQLHSPANSIANLTPGCSRNNSISSVVESTSQAVLTPHGRHQPSNTALNEKILQVLYEVREQNSQILNILQKKIAEPTGEIPKLPVELPLNQMVDLNLLETFIEADENNLSSLVIYLSTIGGKDFLSKTNRILKHLMSDKLASSFSYRGKRNNKRPFCDLHLNDVIIRAVKKSVNNITNIDVEGVIKVWLKHAPQRFAKTK